MVHKIDELYQNGQLVDVVSVLKHNIHVDSVAVDWVEGEGI